MYIGTIPRNWKQLFASDSTDGTGGSVTAPTNSPTRPSGDGVLDLAAGNVRPNQVIAAIVGTNAADETGAVLVTGYRQAVSSAGAPGEWIAQDLLLLAFTLGTLTGVASGIVGTSRLIADTISVTTAYIDSSLYVIHSPANNRMATVIFDALGNELIKFTPAKNTCDSTNILAAGL